MGFLNHILSQAAYSVISLKLGNRNCSLRAISASEQTLLIDFITEIRLFGSCESEREDLPA